MLDKFTFFMPNIFFYVACVFVIILGEFNGYIKNNRSDRSSNILKNIYINFLLIII